MGHCRRTVHRNVDVKTLSIVIFRNFVEYVFTFPFSVVNDICNVFHFDISSKLLGVEVGVWEGLK